MAVDGRWWLVMGGDESHHLVIFERLGRPPKAVS